MRKNGLGPNNNGTMTGRGFGICGHISENMGNGFGNKKGMNCRQAGNIGMGRNFYNAGYNEEEILKLKKEKLEKELTEVNEELKKFN